MTMPSVIGYSIPIIGYIAAPADGGMYYIGNHNAGSIINNYNDFYMQIPVTGTITVCTIDILILGVLGSSQWVQAQFYINGSDSIILTNTLRMDASRISTRVGSLSRAVTAGDLIALKLIMPTFTTNPTTVHVSGNIFIKTN
jgi:hypothetical protein